MTPTLILIVMVLYFGALLTISYITSKGADSNAFFTGNKQSPWYLVAFGMIGTSISGVTFISVPGAVGAGQFSYFQIILGQVLGYLVIILVLMPIIDSTLFPFIPIWSRGLASGLINLVPDFFFFPVQLGLP
jgi:Na+/proline symporter